MFNNKLFKKYTYIAVLTCLFLSFNTITSFAEVPSQKHILILNSYHNGYIWSDDLIKGIHSVLGKNKTHIDISIEYMDSKKFDSTCYFKKLYELYKFKYNDQKFDAVIATDNAAFEFLLKYDNSLFHNTPVVFCGVNNFKDSMLKNHNNFTGIAENPDIKETLDAALKLHHNIENIVIINDSSLTGIANKEVIYKLSYSYTNKLNFIFFNNLDFLNEKEILNQLSNNSIIYICDFSKNNNNNYVLSQDAVNSISQNCSIPIYSTYDIYLNHGVIGGKMISGYSHGQNAGKLALKVLNGEKPSDIAVIKKCATKYMFDYKQLNRFNIMINFLPDNSIIINIKSKSYTIPKELIWLFTLFFIAILSFLIVNISKRRETKRALIESEKRLRILINASPNLICFKNIKGNWLDANKACLDFFNLKNHNWKDKTINELCNLKGISKNDLIEFEQFNETDWYKEPILKYKQKLNTIDGDEKIYDIMKIPVFSSNNTRQALVIIAKDITSDIKAEENKRLLDKLLEYDKIRTKFFANISHELRTPINVILSALQCIELVQSNGITKESKNKLMNYNNTMKQNCYRLTRIINNLIDITKIDSGYFQLQLDNYNIVDVVEEISLSVASYIESKDIDFIFDTNVEEKIMLCDPDIIERIVLNLLSNAIKFTKPGGKISVNVYDRNDYVDIVVKDTGIGIPKSKQKIIFERFIQIDKSLSRNREGSGLGLSLVTALISLCKGDIKLNSCPNRGSEFIISLPVSILSAKKIVPNSNPFITHESYKERINIEFSDIYN
ncbi:ABC transporter substrate binding protein [Clostridium aestuarii]|uniref:histidine kinase n=1 Tax=Clostridium aestuarii TaxID=338193 RepID=A0ABT4D0U4_9CLOT|nr:ABC transporter substrate binding protein [Clostridium aestuarii]MCY6484854.1 ABC transporter substrate binding protein [Clostridium aestuarii]